jgi:hypothetical protein
MKKENLKQKVFKHLDEKGYILDQEYFRLCKNGTEFPNLTTMTEYQKQWHRLQGDLSFFTDKKYTLEKHGKTRIAKLEDGTCYKVGKDFYEMKSDPQTSHII